MTSIKHAVCQGGHNRIMMASAAIRCEKPGLLPPTTPETPDSVAAQARLVSALRDAALIHEPGGSVRVLETHISYVLLTGQFAYKFKKAVDLGFLDYRTLSRRRFYCEEELRLKKRFAPALYLDVVTITGSVEAPMLGGEGPVIEYAVRMRAFPQDALATRTLSRGQLSAAHIDAPATYRTGR